MYRIYMVKQTNKTTTTRTTNPSTVSVLSGHLVKIEGSSELFSSLLVHVLTSTHDLYCLEQCFSNTIITL